MPAMLCPLRKAYRSDKNDYLTDFLPCLESVCAWWDESRGNCAVESRSFYLRESINLRVGGKQNENHI